MRYSHTIVDGIMRLALDGHAGCEAIRSTFEAMAADAARIGASQVLIETKGVNCSATQTDLDEMLKVWEGAARLRSMRIALVVESDIHFGIGRMAMALSDGANLDVRVFRDLLEGLRWLSRREHSDDDTSP